VLCGARAVKIQRTKVKFYRTTKIKFTRREGEISLLRRIKFYPQRSTQTRREMKFKDHASYTRMPMYTARSFNKPDSGLGLKFKYADRSLLVSEILIELSSRSYPMRRVS